MFLGFLRDRFADFTGETYEMSEADGSYGSECPDVSANQDMFNPTKVKYLKQHLDTTTHQKLKAKDLGQFVDRPLQPLCHGEQVGQSDEPMGNITEELAQPKSVKCPGLCVQRAPPDSKLAQVQQELHLWLVYCSNLTFPGDDGDEARTHSYNHNVKKNLTTITHRLCPGTALEYQPGQLALCTHCASLSNDRSLVKMVGRFFFQIYGCAVAGGEDV